MQIDAEDLAACARIAGAQAFPTPVTEVLRAIIKLGIAAVEKKNGK